METIITATHPDAKETVVCSLDVGKTIKELTDLGTSKADIKVNVVIHCPVPRAAAATSAQETEEKPLSLHVVRRRTTLSLIQEDLVQCYDKKGKSGCTIPIKYCQARVPQFPMYLLSYRFDPKRGLGAKAIVAKKSKISFTAAEGTKIPKTAIDKWESLLEQGIDISQNDVLLELTMGDLVKFAIRDYPNLRFHVDSIKQKIKALPGASSGYKRALLNDVKLCAYWDVETDSFEFSTRAVGIVADFAISFLPFSGWIKKGAKVGFEAIKMIWTGVRNGKQMDVLKQKLKISSRCNFKSNELVRVNQRPSLHPS